MSKKDFDNYFNKVASDYHNMIIELQDMTKEYEEGVVSPEVYEQMKQIIAPLKRNYEVLNYVEFLLNKPVKKSKQKRYNNQTKAQQKNCIDEKTITAENKVSLSGLKNLFNK